MTNVKNGQGTEANTYKVSEAGACLACSRRSRVASESKAEWKEGRGRGDDDIDRESEGTADHLGVIGHGEEFEFSIFYLFGSKFPQIFTW